MARQSPLHSKLVSSHASFTQRYNIEIPTEFSDYTTEYNYIRNAAGLTDFSYMQVFTVPEETGLEFLDDLVAGNVAKVRFGRMIHTLLADDFGEIMADCYIANNDDEFILLCESIVDDQELATFFNNHGAHDAGLKNITGEYVLLSIDGFKAWSVVKDLFGADVLGLPYLSIEMYPFKDRDICLFRAGKTSEFGYLLMAPKDLGAHLFDVLLEGVKTYGGGLCGVSIHNALRLEGRFFNIYKEGVLVKDPLSLGLQWMFDFEKEKFSGFDAVMKRRKSGLTQKIIGIRSDVDKKDFQASIPIFDSERQVATITTSCFSPLLNCMVGLALFSIDIAYAGLTFYCGSTKGQKVYTISMPPIMPKSLSVKIDEM